MWQSPTCSMKFWRNGWLLLIFHRFLCLGLAGATGSNPLEQVIRLLTDLQAQVVKDGDAAATAYKEYEMYCQDKAETTSEDIKNNEQQKAQLTAVISKSSSDASSSLTTIEELVKTISELQAKIKEQTAIRERGNADFQAADTELVTSIDMLGKATEILQKSSEDVSLLQTDAKAATSASVVQRAFASREFESIVGGLSTIIDSVGIAAEDGRRLAALLQQQQDAQNGQPEGGTVTGKAASAIVEVLQDLKEKAEDQLRALRNTEADNAHNFDLVKKALENEEAEAQKDLEAERKSKSASEEAKAAAEGDLEICIKALKGAKEVLSLTQSDCQQKAADHDVSVSGSKKELEALTSAKKTIQSAMFIQSPTADDDFGLSFLQVHRKSAKGTSARSKMISKEVVAVVKRLAEEQQSADLAQLASRITAVVRYGAKSGRDPFTKVKKLISEMIARLEREKQAEQSEKEYCDKELAQSTSKKDALDDEMEGLKAKVDQAEAASTELKTQVKEIQMELAYMAKQSGEAEQARADGHKAYVKTTAKLKQSLDSIRSAIRILRDYYAAEEEGGESLLQTDDSLTAQMQQPEAPKKYQKSSSGANSIISLLEVCESDVAQELSEEETEEADDQSAYEKEMNQDKVTKASKDQEIELKTREFKALDKSITELKEDRDTTEEELAAVTKYLAEVTARCIKKDTLEERKARRNAEIKGLEQALQILTSQTSFLQRH